MHKGRGKPHGRKYNPSKQPIMTTKQKKLSPKGSFLKFITKHSPKG